MTSCKREKTMFKAGSCPTGCFYTVALNAICRIIGLLMIRAFRCQIIAFMAIYTSYPERLKLKVGGRLVTGCTISNSMISLKWKSAHLVHSTGILYDPALGIMAFGTIGTHRIVVHISMASCTLSFSFLKFKRLMAAFAIHRLVLPCKFKLRGIVVKRHRRFGHLPVLGSMASRTVNFEPFTMRLLSQTG
jgi:hypothetical protein